MRRIASALRSLVVDAIGPEGAAIAAGFAGLIIIGWSLDWRVGAAIASVGLLTVGIALARPR